LFQKKIYPTAAATAITPPPQRRRRRFNGRPGFPFGFLSAGGRLPKARRGRFFIA